MNLSNIVNRSSERSGSKGTLPSLSFRSLVPQAGTAHSNCRHRPWPPDPERRHLLQPDGARRCSRRPGRYPLPLYADGEREMPEPCVSPLPLGMSYPCSLTVHAARTGSLRYGRTSMPGETLPHAPFPGTLRAHGNTQRNSGVFWRLLLAWFPPSLSPVGRPIRVIRSIRYVSGTRTNWAGRQCPVCRYGWSRGCASTSWRCRRRRDSRPCGIWDRLLRWPCTGSGCGCWWPRGARRSCRGCSTGWSGEPSRWISRRSARAEASRLPAAGSRRRGGAGSRGSGVTGSPRSARRVRGPARRPARRRSASPSRRPAAGRSGNAERPTRGRPLAAPPMPGRAVEPALPTLSALGGGTVGGGVGGAPDLVRLVQTMATQCHRVRLRRAPAQPLAFS